MANPTKTAAEWEAENAAMRAELAALKAASIRSLKCKVGGSGGVSVYGLGRFPVTLYKEQWVTLLDFAQQIKDFITSNASSLKSKGDAPKAKAA